MFGSKCEKGEILITNMLDSQGDERYFKSDLLFYPCNFIKRI